MKILKDLLLAIVSLREQLRLTAVGQEALRLELRALRLYLEAENLPPMAPPGAASPPPT